MDNITTKGIVVAINIFVIISIMSLLIIMFTQMRDIYGLVAKADTSIYSQFNDVYSMYDGKVVTGIGLLNAIKKYEDEPDENVYIEYTGSEEIKKQLNVYQGINLREATLLRELMMDENNTRYNYEDKYNVTVKNDNKGKIVIHFEKTT